MQYLLLALLLIPVSLLAETNLPEIQTVDVSFLPKVKLHLSLPDSSSKLELFEDNRKIRTFRIQKSKNSERLKILTYLSSALKPGTHTVEIRVGDESAKTSYRSSRWRKLGKRTSRKVKIRATGPGYRAIPCRFLAFHESGKIFEDYSTKGGYGRLGTGFILPPGNYYTELRLAGLDIAIDHFKMLVKSDRSTYIHRRFGFLKLPVSNAENCFIDIEKLPGRYPSIHSNLKELLQILPQELPENTLPLPAGHYIVKLCKHGNKTSSEQFQIEINAGAEAHFPAERQ